MNTVTRFLITILLCGGLLAGCAAPKNPLDSQTPEQANFVDAQEIKLKVRELADQMLATVPNDALAGLVAVPTSFVSQDNFQSSSSFGRLLGESLIYEFNQRGFPVREYRLSPGVSMKDGIGDLALARAGGIKTSGEKWAALIVGTYYRDRNSVFVNARLVRASDGMVLRTGQLVLHNNSYVEHLFGPSYASYESEQNKPVAAAPAPLISSGSLQIKPHPYPVSKRLAMANRGKRIGLWGPPID